MLCIVICFYALLPEQVYMLVIVLALKKTLCWKLALIFYTNVFGINQVRYIALTLQAETVSYKDQEKNENRIYFKKKNL